MDHLFFRINWPAILFWIVLILAVILLTVHEVRAEGLEISVFPRVSVSPSDVTVDMNFPPGSQKLIVSLWMERTEVRRSEIELYDDDEFISYRFENLWSGQYTVRVQLETPNKTFKKQKSFQVHKGARER